MRAQYGGEPQKTIGLNYLTSVEPLWFTLADCIASKLLTGKPPEIVQAIRFQPGPVQRGLCPITLAGRRLHPTKADFYRAVIDLRSEIKPRMKAAENDERQRLEVEQLALKILANATSYGIFVEINIEESDDKQTVQVYGGGGKPFTVEATKIERPGSYFHPLLATLITGAARLKLAIAERLAAEQGLSWAFCDTDSMALAKPDGLTETEFLNRAEHVRRWFDSLNPYSAKAPLFKIEDANFEASEGYLTYVIVPLYCFAVSAKRYALYNVDTKGDPLIRKASAHGLGHLMAPYTESDAPSHIPSPLRPGENGIDRWHHDLWWLIVKAALDGRPDQPDLDFHPALKLPARSRYGATTPGLLRWFKHYNEEREYREQVKPFGFLVALQGGRLAESAIARGGRGSRKAAFRPIAPFDRNPAIAASRAFDRVTGQSVPREALQSYRTALAQYHLHPEAKFLNGGYVDAGTTLRRHIAVTGLDHIGKEADRWEEQFFTGFCEDANVDYGTSPNEITWMRDRVRASIEMVGQRRAAAAARVSLRDVSKVARGAAISVQILQRLDRATSDVITHRERPDRFEGASTVCKASNLEPKFNES